MEAYEGGAHAYHATMPTDALTVFRNAMQETENYGFDKICAQQRKLGEKVRALLSSKGIKSVAAEGFQAPGVVVSYTEDPDIQTGKKIYGRGPSNRRWRTLAMRRTRKFSNLSPGPIRPGQTPEHRPHRPKTRRCPIPNHPLKGHPSCM